MLTVRELVAELDVRVLAGESELDLPIRWVHMSELRDPTPWLCGGEVMLTTGMLLDTPEHQREYVELLADRRLAALGFGIGFGHDRVPGPSSRRRSSMSSRSSRCHLLCRSSRSPKQRFKTRQ